jgi:DNA-binding transcriptional LysR family regulator
MEQAQLQSFLTVAKSGSITAAADELFVTQPAVTQQLQALERELGLPLVARAGRGVRLTSAGEALLPYVQRSLALLTEGKRVVADMAGGKVGRLVLGAGVTTSIFHLPRWLSAFQEDYPRIDITVRTGTSRQIAALCKDHQIELGLVTSPLPDDRLGQIALLEEEIVLVLPPSEVNRRTITKEELAQIPLILFSMGTGFRDYLDNALARAGAKVTVKMETDSVEAIKSFVAMGLGGSFLPAVAVQAEVDSGTLISCKVDGLPELVRKTVLIYRKDRYLSAPARAMIAIMRPRMPAS